MFSKTDCPHCKKAKALLTDMGVEFKANDLDQMPEEGPAIIFALNQQTGRTSVPNVFVKGESLGGNDELQELASEGKLEEKLSLS